MNNLKATYIVPTTGDRGPLLVHSIGCILKQSMPELEVFVIGDGVNEATRMIVQRICEQESRVVFFDHAKHESRGEPYRNEALKQAKGEIVCYACDRDLLLPNHLELMWEHTRQYNFVNINSLNILENGQVNFGNHFKQSGDSKHQRPHFARMPNMILSTVGHSLEFYWQLPDGWNTTPEGQYTDHTMWGKFITHPNCKHFTDHTPGLLYFKRGNHPGWSSQKRLAEIESWLAYASDPELLAKLTQRATKSIINERAELFFKTGSRDRQIKHLQAQLDAYQHKESDQ